MNFIDSIAERSVAHTYKNSSNNSNSWMACKSLFVGNFNFDKVFSWILTWCVLENLCRYKYTCLQFENINNFLFLSKRRCMIHVYFTSRKHNIFIVRRWNKDLTSAIVLFLFPYNLFCCHLFLGIKVYLFLGIFQLQRFENGCIYVQSNLYWAVTDTTSHSTE